MEVKWKKESHNQKKGGGYLSCDSPKKEYIKKMV
jgi:hypothetical protein